MNDLISSSVGCFSRSKCVVAHGWCCKQFSPFVTSAKFSFKEITFFLFFFAFHNYEAYAFRIVGIWDTSKNKRSRTRGLDFALIALLLFLPCLGFRELLKSLSHEQLTIFSKNTKESEIGYEEERISVKIHQWQPRALFEACHRSQPLSTSFTP